MGIARRKTMASRGAVIARLATRRGFHSSSVARCRRSEAFHELNGGAQHSSLMGSALETSPGYENTVHEQAELWWDDGRAVVEPVLDGDYIPLREATSMMAAGFGFFALIGAIQYWRDPATNRPTVPRVMPDAEIWERNQYVAPPATAEDQE